MNAYLLALLMRLIVTDLDAPITDNDMLQLEVNLVNALDAYCEPIEYRDEICQVNLEQGFGDPR